MAERKPAAASGGGASRAPGLGAGILIGVLLGIGLALAVAIWLNVRGSPFSEREVPAELPALKVPPPVAPAQAPPAVAKPADAAEDEAGNGQRFDFYEILPGAEATAVARPRINLPVALYLQAGAFRSPTDADDRKAQLNLLGQTAVVQRVQVGENLLHRIRVGPFATQAELEQVRAFLSQNGIESIPMRPETTASP